MKKKKTKKKKKQNKTKNQPIQWNVRQYLVPIKNSELYSDPQLVQAPGY